MNYCTVGWAHSPFAKLEQDLESLIVDVATRAVADAGIEPKDVDAIFLGNFNSGMNRQGFPSSLVLQAHDDFRFKPATRLENACATGSAAIHAGLDYLAAKRGRIVLVVGAEKMSDAGAATVADALLSASYRKEESDITGGFVGVFARIAQQYFERYGDCREDLARIAAKNHQNALANPFAQLRKPLDFDFCNTISDKNPEVVAPLKRSDCSPVSDGAAAMIITDADTAAGMAKRVGFRARAQVNDYLPMSRRDVTFFDGGARAWQQALDQAGMKVTDLSFVETHDCFTIAELIEYEAMGLTARGEGALAIREGWVQRDGKLPVNISGGLKAKGHPVGATGVSMHVMSAMQLTGEAPEGLQLANANSCGIFNMGGAAVANYVSILERMD